MLASRARTIAVAFVVVAGVGFASAPAAQALVPLKGGEQTVTGTGDSVPSLSPVDEPVIVTLTHDGASNFIVGPIGADGEEGFSWANEIGPFTGTTFQEMDDLFAPYGKKNPIVAVQVKADGNWSIQLRKLSQAAGKNIKQGNGAGNDVIRFTKASSGFKRITLTHDGSSNFIVKPIDSKGESGSSLVNEIGPYKGTVRLPSGTKYLWVKADGAWTYSTK